MPYIYDNTNELMMIILGVIVVFQFVDYIPVHWRYMLKNIGMKWSLGFALVTNTFLKSTE